MPKCTWKIEEYQPLGLGFVPQLVRSETPAVLRFSACPLLVCLALPCYKKKIGLAQLLLTSTTVALLRRQKELSTQNCLVT